MPFCHINAADKYTDSILTKVYNYTNTEHLQIEEFTSNAYTRFYIQTNLQNRVMRLVPGMSKMRKGNKTYCGEDFTTFHVKRPANIEREVKGFYSTLPRINQIHDRVLSNLSLSVYAPSLFSDRILSPLHYKNRRYYKYERLYSYINGTCKITRLKVKSKFHNTQLVNGFIEVDEKTGRVDNFILSGYYDMVKFKISATMGKAGLSSLLPKLTNVELKIKILKNTIIGNFSSTYTYHEMMASTFRSKKQIRKHLDLTKSYQFINKTISPRSDISYFDSIRPEALPPEFIKLLTQQDTVTEKKTKYALNDFSNKMTDALLGTHYINILEKGKIKIPPVIALSSFQYTQTKGFTVETHIPSYIDFKNGGRISVDPYLGYSFKLKQFYWKVPLNIMLFPQTSTTFKLETGNGNRIYNSQQADYVRKKFQGVSHYDTLIHIFDHFKFYYYKDFYVNSMLSVSPVPGMNFEGGIRFHKRTLINYNRVAQISGLDSKINTFAPHLRIEWTPYTSYYRVEKRKVPIGSKYPSFMIDYERGLPWKNCKSQYEKWEFDMKYKMELYALHSIFLKVGGGLYTTRKTIYFVDFDNFRDVRTPQGWNNEILGQFQLLDSRWYNESPYYARISVAYNSPMLFLSRIPVLTRIVQSEQIYCNVLSVASLQPYTEFGYGFNTHIVDAAAFVSLSKGAGIKMGGKLSIRLFNGW